MAATMNVPEPPQSRFDLRWRLAGASWRINPFFWLSGALLGLRYYADPEAGSLGYFAFWMAVVLLSVLAHHFGQVLVGRLFGLKGEVVLSGLGGLTLGISALPARSQRLVVLLAGPLLNALLAALVLAVTWFLAGLGVRNWGWAEPIVNGLVIACLVNAFWALVTVLPLWPLDGGQMACEIGQALFGRRGNALALGLSILVAGLLAVLVTLVLSQDLDRRFDPRYALNLERDCVLLLFCFLFWVRGVTALWPAHSETPG